MEMMDYVHECLVCKEISYEVDGDALEDNQTYKLYMCGTCGFEWEVVGRGK